MPGFLQLKLFGRLEAHREGELLTRFRSRQTRRMLGFLALQGGAEVSYDLLAARLWPVPILADSAPVDADALANVRQSVKNLIDLLGADRLRKVGRSVVQLVLDDAWIDVLAFDAATDLGTRASLETAIALYTGDLMEDCLDAWIEPARHARRVRYQAALRRLAEEAETRLDFLGAEGYLRSLIASDWRKEGARRDLMLLLARQGEYHAAMGVYHDWRDLLHDPHLGPGAEIEALYQTIRSEVLRADPAPKREETPLYRLPRPLVELIGRDTEAAEIRTRMTFARFVTLKGPPGVGKTLLAQHVAWSAREDYPGGVAFVDAADVSDPVGLWAEIASVLGIALRPPHREPAVIRALQERRMLLLLDNCDRIALRGGPVIRQLLQECPYLHLLTTSRTAWRSDLGERVIPVAPLRTPSAPLLRRAPEDLARLLPDYSAICLFVETAANRDPEFLLTPRNAAVVAQLCCLLDGLPLAIQLVAHWAAVLSPEQMLASVIAGQELLRVSDRRQEHRHMTLRAAFDFGYRQLDVKVQRLFRRLAIFQGGWTQESAEQVCADPAAVEALQTLQEYSLIVSEGDAPTRRFRMLETIRQFAHERLTETADLAFVRERHLDAFLALAESLVPVLNSPEQAAGLERLEREHGNLRAALAASCELGEGEKGLRLAGALSKFWRLRGHNTEGTYWLDRLLASAPSASPAVRAVALGANGVLAMQRSDFKPAAALFTERLAIDREAGRLPAVASTLGNLASIASYENDLVRSRELYEQSLSHFRELDDSLNIAITLSNLAIVLDQEGDPVASRRSSLESIALLRELQDPHHLGVGLRNLADTHRQLGEYPEALAALQEGLDLAQELEDVEGLSDGLFLVADIAVRKNRMEEAAVLFGACEVVRERADLPPHTRVATELESGRELALAHLGTLVFEDAVSRGRRMSEAEACAYVTSVISLL